MGSIAELINLRAGRVIALPMSDANRPAKWHRVDCPYCEGKKHGTAAVNYDAQWFHCYRCDTSFGVGGKPNSDWMNPDQTWILNRFKYQIDRVAGRVRRDYGDWLKHMRKDLRQEAKFLVLHYAYGKPGGPNDSGSYWDWEDDCVGDVEKLNGYVGRALWGDLRNWAERRVKHMKKERSFAGNETGNPALPSLDVVSDAHQAKMVAGQRDAKYLRRLTSNGLQPDRFLWLLAEERFKVKGRGKRGYRYLPFTAWGKDVLRCGRMRNGLGPRKGHCRWCDRALAKPRPYLSGDALWNWDVGEHQKEP